MFVREGGGVPKQKLDSSSGENRIFYSHFRGVQSNYEAIDNVFIVF